MKKISTHIYIVLAIFLVAFILGSFFDLQISEAIFSRDDALGLTISILGTLVGYSCFAIVGGAFIAVILDKTPKEKLWMKIIFYILGVFSFLASIYFAGREFFGSNGFTNSAPEFVGYIITIPFMCLAGYFGYRLGHGSDNPRLWLLLVIFLLLMFLALVPGVTLLKQIFHRPRYRMISNSDVAALNVVSFHNWWERCSDYKNVISICETNNVIITSEEFKSFPSGHAGASALVMLFAVLLPAFSKEHEKIQIPLFYIAFIWCLLICFSRILVGAHFLSDVAMGGILTMIFTLIGYYVVYRSKLFSNNEKRD